MYVVKDLVPVRPSGAHRTNVALHPTTHFTGFHELLHAIQNDRALSETQNADTHG